jgi:hypothetical protein
MEKRIFRKEKYQSCFHLLWNLVSLWHQNPVLILSQIRVRPGVFLNFFAEGFLVVVVEQLHICEGKMSIVLLSGLTMSIKAFLRMC